MNQNEKERGNLKWRYHQWHLYFLFSLVIGVAAILLTLMPSALDRLIADADTPALMLKGHADWYLSLLAVGALATIIPAGFGIKAFIFYAVNHSNPKYESVKFRIRVNHIPMSELGLVVLIWILFLFIPAMIVDINPLEQYQKYMEDVAAIEEGNLKTLDGQIEKGYERDGFAKHGQDYPVPFRRYRTYDPDSGWISVYVPDFLDFTADSEHPYKESQSVEWNEDHAATYRMTYTPNFHLATSMEILRAGTD